MVDYETFEVMEDLVESVSDSVGTTIEDYHDNALSAYDFLAAPGGHIDLLGVHEPEIYSDDIETIAEWDGDHLSGTYGIDASVTREETFTNGIRLVLTNAKAGVVGENDHSIADESRVVMGLYDEHGEIDLEPGRVTETDTVTADLHLYTNDDPGELQRMVKDLTRTYAEGKHLRRVVDADEGFVFLDGPLYPPQVLSEVMARYRGGFEDAWTDVLGENVGNYIHAIERTVDHGWPIVGIVKSMDTSSLVNDLCTKIETQPDHGVNLVWETDNAFLLDLLQPASLSEFVSTSWFEETRRYCRIRGEDGSAYVEPFTGSPYCSHDLDTYHRAFFYVRLPGTGTVMRIETAKGYVDDAEARDLIRKRALAEIARSQSSPECILHADEKARITRQNQDTLFTALYQSMQKDLNYHHDVRNPNYISANY